MGRNKVKPEQASKVRMRMPTLRSFGEGRTRGQVCAAVDCLSGREQYRERATPIQSGWAGAAARLERRAGYWWWSRSIRRRYRTTGVREAARRDLWTPGRRRSVDRGLPTGAQRSWSVIFFWRNWAVLSAPQRGCRTPQSTAMRSTGQDKIITPALSSGGVRSEFRSSGEEYETSFTSQSVQPKPRAGPGRQPASDAVNTRLL